MGGGNLGRDSAGIAVRSDGFADLLQQRIEHQPGIADKSDLGLDILVEMRGIQGRMDDGLAFGHADAEGRLRERAANAENQIGLTEEFGHSAGHCEPAGPQRKRMRLGE